MLRLLSRDERDKVTIGGTTFHFRKVPHGLSTALNRKFTKKGKLDEVGLERALWLHVLVGWDDLADAAGNLLPFSTELVEFSDPLTGEPEDDPETGAPRREPLAYVVAMTLPDAIADVIVGRARSLEVKVEGALGNSDPSSAKPPARTATP